MLVRAAVHSNHQIESNVGLFVSFYPRYFLVIIVWFPLSYFVFIVLISPSFLAAALLLLATGSCLMRGCTHEHR